MTIDQPRDGSLSAVLSKENLMNNSGAFQRTELFVNRDSSEKIKAIGDYLVDKKFCNYFKQLKQVFMYITDRCNCACSQCIYKPNINHYINEEIPLGEALSLLKLFKSLGASKVTFLGGETTLYGSSENRKPLLNLIKETKVIGYEYVRLDTNGQLIQSAVFQELCIVKTVF